MQRFTSSGLAYLLPLVMIGPVSAFFFVEFGESVLIRGNPLLVVSSYILAAITFVLWIPYRSSRRWPPVVYAFLLSLVLLWILSMVLTQYHGNLWYRSALIFPFILLLLITKRPTGDAAWKAADVFATLIVIVILFTVVQESLGLHNHDWPTWYQTDAFRFGSTRWFGSLGNPNLTAPLGAFLIIYSLVRSVPMRLLWVPIGFATLVLTMSRTSLLATVLAILIILTSQYRSRIPTWMKRHRQLLLPLAALAVLVLGIWTAVTLGFTFSGRSPIWSTYWAAFTANPIFGVGDWGVPVHAHNTWLDSATRHGVVTGLLLVLVWVLALIIGIQNARSGSPIGLGLWMYLALLGLTETPFDWRFLSLLMTMFLFIPLLGADRQTVEGEQSPAKTEYSI
jgi:hypothetical protein